MKWADDNRTTLIVNEHIQLADIPPEAHEYQVNGRTPMEWFIDRYQVKQPRRIGIVNDPNGLVRGSGGVDCGDTPGRVRQRGNGAYCCRASGTVRRLRQGVKISCEPGNRQLNMVISPLDVGHVISLTQAPMCLT